MKLFILTAFLVYAIAAESEFKCPSPSGLFPHPKLCSYFYNCGNGIPTKMQCPEDLVFNVKNNQCDHLENVDDCTNEVPYTKCLPSGEVGCTMSPGPDDIKCCGRSTCYYDATGDRKVCDYVIVFP